MPGGGNRDGFVHESDGKLLINHSASSLIGLSYNYVFTLTDYDSSNGTCYLTAISGNKVSGTEEPMTTVASPEGKITLVTEGSDKWDLKYGEGNWFNTQTNETYGPYVNTWTSQEDTNASWEIYLVDEETTFAPEAGKAYYIDCLKSGNGRAVYLPGAQILGLTGDNDALHLGNLFTVSTVTGTYGETYYQIKSYAKPDAYVYYMNTNDANANVGITTDASSANLKWTITKSRASNVAGFNIIPSTGRNGWNCRGNEPVWNNTAIGQWWKNNNSTDDNTWGFVPQTDENVATAKETYKTAVHPPFGTVGSCSESDYTAALNLLTGTEDIFMAPWRIPGQMMIKPTSASGLYKIKNKSLNKYLFQDTDNKNIAFINDGGDNTKYYYKVTFDGNQATIVNSNGKPLAKGNQGTNYENAQTIVASPVSLTYCGGNGYFLFPGTHSTAQNHFTKGNAAYNSSTNPYFLTTWTSTEAANQYTFEGVTLQEDNVVYDVQFEGLKGLSGDDALTVTYNGTGYTGNTIVGNGGFYVFSTTPQAADFTAPEASNDYDAGVVTVDAANHLIKVSFEAKKANLTLLVTMDGVKYHEASVDAPLNESYTYSPLFEGYQWLLTSNAALTVNNEVKAIADVFGESGNITPTGNTTYTFALKTTDFLQEGKLYQISSAITKPLTSQNGRGGKKMYGKPGMIYTKAVGDDLATERFLAMAHSLWKFEYTDDARKYFKIYNEVTGQYMGPVVNNTTIVAFTDEAGAGIYKLIPASALHLNATNTTTDMANAMYPGALFKIAASDATAETGNKKKLHIQNSGNNQLIGFDDEEIWSKWYFTASEATIAKVDYVKSIEERLLNQERITPSSMTDMTNMTYSTNAQQTTEGALQQNDAWVLNDGKSNTYFHSRYNNTGYDDSTPDPDVHWLQVDLGENNDMTSFSFYTKRRMDNNNNRPTEIEVQLSEDGTNFHYLYTLYGIPTTNDDFYSPSYPLNKAKDTDGNEVSISSPRYLRFIVKATNTGTKYFTFSEFHIQTTKGVLPDALAEASLKAGKAAIDAVCSPYNTKDGYYQEASDTLYEARNNALAYVAAHTTLKDRIADLTPYTNLTDLVEGDEVHQFTIARTATTAENWKTALNEINGYVDNVNNENINTKTGCETVLATLPTITLNTPKPGQIYRLKSLQLNETNGTYATAGQTTLSASPATDPTEEKEKAVMLQYTDDGRLVSPITGTELTVNGLNHFNFSEHRSVKGTYRVATYDPEGTSGNNARILYANTMTENKNGKIDYSAINGDHETVTNTSWYLEPVKSYSVKMNPVEDHRWATFYSDKKVFLPEGVQARYVKSNDNGNWTETAEGSKIYELTYTQIAEDGILPAETGVWLYKETTEGNEATEPDSVVLYESTFNEATSAADNNWFVGSEEGGAYSAANGTLYALGKPNGNPAGFYRFANTDGTYTLTKNKAYLQVPADVANTLNARGFIFVDGDNTTGIEEIQPVAAGEDNGVYYDLTGKKVINPTRSGIYIKNGKKLVIK